MPLPPVDTIVLASGNPGKVREIADIFAEIGITIIAQGDIGIDPAEETGHTFAENALLKARHAAASSGLPAMADDSGIVVDALQGRPGVRSARYAGKGASDDDNIDKLLEEMSDVDDEHRGGAFHCAAALAFPGDTVAPVTVEAVWRGTILRRREGEAGFGYDPIFLDPVEGKTGAQMSRKEKNAVSHRGKAFRQLRAILRESRQGRA